MTQAAEMAAPGAQCGQEVGLASLRGVWPSGLANTRKRPQTPANARKHPQTPTSTHKQVATGEAPTNTHRRWFWACAAPVAATQNARALCLRELHAKTRFRGPCGRQGRFVWPRKQFGLLWQRFRTHRCGFAWFCARQRACAFRAGGNGAGPPQKWVLQVFVGAYAHCDLFVSACGCLRVFAGVCGVFANRLANTPEGAA